MTLLEKVVAENDKTIAAMKAIITQSQADDRERASLYTRQIVNDYKDERERLLFRLHVHTAVACFLIIVVLIEAVVINLLVHR